MVYIRKPQKTKTRRHLASPSEKQYTTTHSQSILPPQLIAIFSHIVETMVRHKRTTRAGRAAAGRKRKATPPPKRVTKKAKKGPSPAKQARIEAERAIAEGYAQGPPPKPAVEKTSPRQSKSPQQRSPRSASPSKHHTPSPGKPQGNKNVKNKGDAVEEDEELAPLSDGGEDPPVGSASSKKRHTPSPGKPQRNKNVQNEEVKEEEEDEDLAPLLDGGEDPPLPAEQDGGEGVPREGQGDQQQDDFLGSDEVEDTGEANNGSDDIGGTNDGGGDGSDDGGSDGGSDGGDDVAGKKKTKTDLTKKADTPT